MVDVLALRACWSTHVGYPHQMRIRLIFKDLATGLEASWLILGHQLRRLRFLGVHAGIFLGALAPEILCLLIIGWDVHLLALVALGAVSMQVNAISLVVALVLIFASVVARVDSILG